MYHNILKVAIGMENDNFLLFRGAKKIRITKYVKNVSKKFNLVLEFYSKSIL